MAFKDITSRPAILDAIAECDRIGREKFLEKYGFGRARDYVLLHDGREYDSKAIVGAAHGYQFPMEGPLTNDVFSGGAVTVQALLERLGFTILRKKSTKLPGKV